MTQKQNALFFHPSEDEFNKKATEKKYSCIPVWIEIKSDLFTPVTTYLSFREDSPYSFVLESVNQNSKMGRYSLVGFDPLLRFEKKQEVLSIYLRGEKIKEEKSEKPLKQITAFAENHRPYPDKGIKGFDGSLFGYANYNIVSDFEKIPDENPDDLSIPDIHFVIPSILLVFDHLRQTLKIIALAISDEESAYEKAKEKIFRIVSKLREKSYPVDIFSSGNQTDEKFDFKSNMTKEEYLRIVEKGKEYIREGDVFQVVLSQRFQMNYSNDPFRIYRALRSENPSPYHYHLRYDDYSLSGSSPEVLVKKDGRDLILRPIAGTCRRGATEEEDALLSREMLNDPKEMAEHMMLLDLGRNDLGRVCEFNSVKVDEQTVVEKYSHVMHIVSNISGKATKNLDLHDLLRSVFPAGTLSGAPKVRAMEIIDELETVRRNTYAGSVLTADFYGNINACITIRSVLCKNNKAYIQAGAGIVADSDPASEYRESLNKAMAVMKAVHSSSREP